MRFLKLQCPLPAPLSFPASAPVPTCACFHLLTPLQAMPHLAVFQQGCVAAASLFAVIERTSAQASPAGTAPITITLTSSQAGAGQGKAAPKSSRIVYTAADGQLVPAGASCRGDLELSCVSFAYPARLERPVFQGLSLVFPAGGDLLPGCLHLAADQTSC